MFKKLKDKLAEEVKSSPQRIQQFAQAAQAAVTSASSSISDITNNDLFSIGDNDTQKTPTRAPLAQSRNDAFKDVSLTPQSAPALPNAECIDRFPNDIVETQRQRRLSNSSFASDVSFKLPSYESPLTYNFQSDMDVSGSEAEERGLASPGAGAAGLERVTKEQLFAAYRRTQQRYAKYRSQYADLARHYKLLERENAKARSVLVETQDKALRRISELREQCSLEQSAKAHLERALREDIDERNIKIDTLTTKIKLLQSNSCESEETATNVSRKASESSLSDAQLVDLSVASEPDPLSAEVTALNNKIDKMEQLMNKYKESLKAIKEKNSQLTTELQVVSNELDNKTKEIEQLNTTTSLLAESQQHMQELKEINEEMQNKINTYDFTKTKEISSLEIDYKKSQDEITLLKDKINTFSKREEEYAISLAENKLSIHKELESKEAEIKTLNASLSESKKEVRSLGIVVNEYKNNVLLLEEERAKLKLDVTELKEIEKNLSEKVIEFEGLKQKYQILEQSKTKADEAYKCLELQAKQETAEKLAILDRNSYLEHRNKQISDECTKKAAQLTKLENELEELRHNNEYNDEIIIQKSKASDEISLWKERYETLQSEIQEERVELVKLQTEIEKLLSNHDSVRTENSTLKELVAQLEFNKNKNQETFIHFRKNMKSKLDNLKEKTSCLREFATELTDEVKTLKNFNTETVTFANSITDILKHLHHENEIKDIKGIYDNLKTEFDNIGEKMHNLKQQYESTLGEAETLREEKQKLLDKIHYLETEKDRFVVEHQKLSYTTNQHAKVLTEMETLNNENTTMALKINEAEEQCNKLQSELKQANSRYELEIKNLQTEMQELISEAREQETTQKQAINRYEVDMKWLQTEIEELTSKAREQEIRHKQTLDEFNEIKKEKHALFTKVQNSEHNKTDAEKLQRNLNELTHENSTLKRNFENIASNFKTLENELAEVRQSHSEIENEKDRLSTIIKIFEQSELKKSARSCQETQTVEDFGNLMSQLHNSIEETNILKTKCETVKQEKEDLYEQVMTLEQKNSENERILDDKQKVIDHITSQHETLQKILDDKQKVIDHITSQHETLQKKYEKLNIDFEKAIETNVDLSSKLTESVTYDNIDSFHKCEDLETERDILKDENRRLQSDIEGLQTYLTKISKENSTLNDKLREVISSSESTGLHDSSALTQDIVHLKNEIETEKEKSIDLTRQNTLLAEENLELKDQLQSQNYVQPIEMKAIELNANESSHSASELATLRDRHNNVKKAKKELEDKLYNSEHLNQSVNNNLKQLQESNHKLRTSNEKLERRLDEALVSLRHLHSLQENTELEYLRNILYEYLTGSGAHSETLAKVLAAVVKFDDTQTQLVIQKERERQGLLRQLGLL